MDLHADGRARRPYVDRPMTPDDGGAGAAAAAAVAWNLSTPVPMRRGMNELYECGETVLRVGHATAAPELAHALAAVLASHGVRTVEPVAGAAGVFEGLPVTGWRRLAAVDVAVDWAAVGAAVARVHAIAPDEVPAGYPVPDPSTFPWWDFDSMLDDVAADVDEPALEGLRAAVARHAGWTAATQTSPVLCHGDVHPGNVVMTELGAVLLDWDLLCHASAVWDHAMLLTYAGRWGGDPATYPAFAGGYGRAFTDDPLATALGELRNVAATLMRVRAGRSDPAAAAEAERRLRWWRGDPGAPVWQAQ